MSQSAATVESTYISVSDGDDTYCEEEGALRILAVLVVGQKLVELGIAFDLHVESANQMTYKRIQGLDRELHERD